MKAPARGHVSSKLERKRRVLKRFGHLLELNSDIGRNASDMLFAGTYNSGVSPLGKIHYVFDENIFELFIQPFDRHTSSYCANFYDADWGYAKLGRSYCAQAGMIAAEYLFSGKLPGTSPESPIYITEWHYAELKNRLRSLRKSFSKAGKKQADQISDAEKYADEQRVYLETTGSLQSKLEHALGHATPEAVADTKRLLQVTKNNEAAALRFIYARALAPRLVDDRIVEPLEQLDRVLSDILTRVMPLSFAFTPKDGRDREELDKLITEWTQILTERHADKSSPGRIEYDAKSVANVHWIARRKLKRDERIMLVTGDSRLYEAYSSWHNEQDGAAFLLRRVNQFAPLINPHDTPNDIQAGDEGGYVLFDSIRQAMDAPLVSFNLSKKEQGRPFLASFLKKSRRPEDDLQIRLFTENLSADWWQERDDAFEQLRDKWREAERLAIGASLPVLERRLERRIAFLSRVGTAANSSEAFSRYLSDLLFEIAEKGLSLDFPDAVRFVHDRPAKRVQQQPRVPLHVRLLIPNSGPDQIDLAGLIERWIRGDDETTRLLDPDRNPQLFARLDVVYAVAAALALRMEMWVEADRFAENAAAASDMLLAKGDKSAESPWLECLYLSALAKRFLIASTSPYSPVRGEDQWRESLEQAIQSLNQAEARHNELGDQQCTLRAISERVAVRLFYVTWGAVASEATLNEAGFDPAFTQEQLDAIPEDLEKGWELLDARKTDPGAPTGTLIVNAASFAVVGELFRRRGKQVPALNPVRLERIEHELDAIVPNLQTLPPIVSVDLYAFLWLVRGRKEACEPLRAALTAGDINLAMDAQFARILQMELGEGVAK